MDRDSVRAELIQVAAVAQAMVQLLDTGSTAMVHEFDRLHARQVSIDVQTERDYQYRRWANQVHPMEQWVCILMEEVGEAVKAINDRYVFPKIEGPT